MNAQSLVLMAAVSVLPLNAQPPATAVEPAPEAREAGEKITAAIDGAKALLEILQNVDSKEKADAAAPKLIEFRTKLEGLEPPSEEIKAQLDKEVEGVFRSIARIVVNDSYNSDAFMAALVDMDGEQPAAVPLPELSAEEQAEYAKLLDLTCESIETLKQAIAVFAGITSKETADAAAPKVKELFQKIEKLEERLQELPEPSAAVGKRMQKDFKLKLKVVTTRAVARRITTIVMGWHEGYGSTALEEATIPGDE